MKKDLIQSKWMKLGVVLKEQKAFQWQEKLEDQKIKKTLLHLVTIQILNLEENN